jgi:hypothetical protein
MAVVTGYTPGSVQISNLWSFSYSKPVVLFMSPFPADALGETVRLYGRNFVDKSGQIISGDNVPASYVRVGNLECSSLRDEVVGSSGSSERALVCETVDDVVGTKNVTLSVATQETYLSEDVDTNSQLLGTPFVYRSVCSPSALKEQVFASVYDEAIAANLAPSSARALAVTTAAAELTGYYGKAGELCVACPQGAFCNGSNEDPVALASWYMTNVSYTSSNAPAECAARRVGDQQCFKPLRCEPREACIGLNFCKQGYEGFRCQKCIQGFYRIDGACERCPDNPWVTLVIIAVAILFFAFLAWILNARQTNIAFIAIGVDYFQVLAIFARTRSVLWPASIKLIFRIASAFNLNIELVAPECAIPSFGFVMKWFATMSLPLVMVSLFLVVFVVQLLFKLCCRNNKGVFKNKLWSHADPLVSMVVTGMYVLYLTLTRSTLDVFNCSPVFPPDGQEYLSGQTDIVCWKSAVHLLLVPFGIVALAVYVIGFPLFAYLFTNRFKLMIRADQILRAKGVNPLSEHMPEHLARFRRRWHRLYYMFKPGTATKPWIVVLILRKAAIAASALTFRATPSYLLAMVLLVLFVSYVIHVRSQPYMAPRDFEPVVQSHSDHVLANIRIAKDKSKPVDWDKDAHMKIERIFADHREHLRSITKKNMVTSKTWSQQEGEYQRTRSVQKALLKGGLIAVFLIDYNAVESVLLACGILVNLSGLMFLSERFSSPQLLAYYKGEYDGLAWAVVALVVLSVLYFFTVFLVELLIMMNPKAAGRCCSLCAILCRPCLGGARRRAKKRMGKEGGAGLTEELRPGGAMYNPELLDTALTDDPSADLQMQSNTGLGDLSSAAAGVKAADLPSKPPEKDAWGLIRTRFIELERQLRESTELAKERDRAARGVIRMDELGAEPASPGAASPGGVMENPMMARAYRGRGLFSKGSPTKKVFSSSTARGGAPAASESIRKRLSEFK